MSKLDPVVAISVNTFRETVRDRILYVFYIFACLVTVLGLLLGSLSVGQNLRVIEDLGLSAIAIIGGIIAVFAGTNLVYKELEHRTIYLIFTKPVSSWQFILGKYVGLSACVFVMLLAMGLFLAGLLFCVDPAHSLDVLLPRILSSLSLVYLELLFITACATFYSTFASPIMSVVFTLSIWLIGHFTESLRELGRLSVNPTVATISEFAYWLLPDLAGLTRVRAQIMYGRQPAWELDLFLVCYVLACVILLLVCATIVNEKREFP